MEAADLGPISPELALIDPALARRARELLPEPRERPRPRAPLAAARAEPIVAAPSPEPEIEPARRHRWAQTLVLAAVIFAAGLAASGSIVAPRHVASPGATLEIRTVATPAQRQPKHKAIDQPALHPSRPARGILASNLLGVVTKMSPRRVVLVWHRANSGRVVVLRSRGRGRSHVVYRGRGTRYEDRSIEPCTTYRYTLVSYDRRGHRSTGVSSSVVTGCT